MRKHVKPIQVGIIGMGFIGKLQLDALLRIPEVQVVAVSSTQISTREQMKTLYGIEKVYEHWMDLVHDPDVKVVHNCTPNTLHYEINSEIISLGKHLYAEKPLGMDAKEARAMCDLLTTSPVANAVNHQYRSNAAIREMKKKLQSSDCGHPLFIKAHYLQESQCRQDDYNARSMPEDNPARALLDIGSHVIDLIQFLIDDKIESVCAAMITNYPNRLDKLTLTKIPIASDDTTSVQFTLKQGLGGVFLVSKVAHGHKNDLEISISCENGEVSWRQEEPDRYQYQCRETGNTTIYMNPKLVKPEVEVYVTLPAGHVMGWADALKNNIQQFYQSIQEGTYTEVSQSYTTFLEGLWIQQIIDLCIISSDKKCWVSAQEIGL